MPYFPSSCALFFLSLDSFASAPPPNPLPPLNQSVVKVESSENSNEPQVSYVPWTKAKWQSIAKEFPKLIE